MTWQLHPVCCSDPASTSLLYVLFKVLYLSATKRYGEKEDRDFLYGGEEDGGWRGEAAHRLLMPPYQMRVVLFVVSEFKE